MKRPVCCGWRLTKTAFRCLISILCSPWPDILTTMWSRLEDAKKISCSSPPPKQSRAAKNTISQEAARIAPEPLNYYLMQANHRYIFFMHQILRSWKKGNLEPKASKPFLQRLKNSIWNFSSLAFEIVWIFVSFKLAGNWSFLIIKKN